MPVFTGSAVELITPFHKGAVDFTALTRILELQIASGTDAVCVLGTTGEAATLSTDERLSVIQFVVERVNGRVPVLAATGGNSTEAVIESSKTAEAIGVDALVVVTPYFAVTTQAGLVTHYNAVADSVQIPLLVHNAPRLTGCNVLPGTMAELMQNENISGVLEASGNIEQIVNLAALCPECDIYCGCDDHVLPVLSVGGKGVIGSIANALPDVVHALCETFQKGDAAAARELQIQLIPLWKAARIEETPGPIKAMMGLMKLCDTDMRLPMQPPSGASMRVIKETLKAYGLI